MEEMQNLFNVDIGVFILSFFIIAIALKQLIDLLIYFKKKFGIKTNAETDKTEILHYLYIASLFIFKTKVIQRTFNS